MNLLNDSNFYMDHRNANRKQDYFINKLISTSNRIISFHMLISLLVIVKNMKKLWKVRELWSADDIYFYGDFIKKVYYLFIWKLEY